MHETKAGTLAENRRGGLCEGGGIWVGFCTIIYMHKESYSLSFFHYAGRPTPPHNSTCDYHKYSDLISVVVNVTDIMLNNNKETEISYVSITVSNTRDLEQLVYNYSISSITKTDILNATFSFFNYMEDNQIRAYIIAVDKCGHESLSEVTNCKPLGAKGIL